MHYLLGCRHTQGLILITEIEHMDEVKPSCGFWGECEKFTEIKVGSGTFTYLNKSLTK